MSATGTDRPATARVRDELARTPLPVGCDARAEIAGVLRSAGSLSLRGGYAVEATVGDPAVARRIVSLLRATLAAPTEVRLLEPGRGRPRARFVVRTGGVSLERLTAATLLDAAGRPPAGIPRSVTRRCCSAAYLRGAFLGRGSVAAARGSAHLEIRAPDDATADGIISLLGRLGVRARGRRHRGSPTVYVKETAAVGRVLAAMGAHGAYLAWEAAAVWSGVRGEAARLANADAANARRLARAAVAQRAAAEAVLEAHGAAALPRALREAAELRLAHPQASLDELGRLCAEPVSKSAMAQRFRRLAGLATNPVSPRRRGERHPSRTVR